LCVLVVLQILSIEADVWQRWSDHAWRLCNKATSQKDLPIGMCDNLQEVVEEAMQNLALQMTQAMSKTPDYRDELVLRSLKNPYRSDGERIMKSVVNWMVLNRITSQTEIQREFGSKFGQWFLNLAVDNKQTAFTQGMSFEEITQMVNQQQRLKEAGMEEEPVELDLHEDL
jgi:hypothetical protein